MPRRPDARTLLFEKIRTSPPKFVHVIGVPYAVEREAAGESGGGDRVWITVEAPPFGRLRVSVNTTSLLSRGAAADPRIRVGIVTSRWDEKPAPGLSEDRGQNYAKLEAAFKATCVEMEQEDLATLLTERLKRAVRTEVWGDLYAQEHLGVRQLHCRRASAALRDDLQNRDGALKLYYPEENSAELFLFKFAGQP